MIAESQDIENDRILSSPPFIGTHPITEVQ